MVDQELGKMTNQPQEKQLIIKCNKFGAYHVRWDKNGGNVPKELSGMYTHREKAEIAIRVYKDEQAKKKAENDRLVAEAVALAEAEIEASKKAAEVAEDKGVLDLSGVGMEIIEAEDSVITSKAAPKKKKAVARKKVTTNSK